jgi:hypothetical protein
MLADSLDEDKSGLVSMDEFCRLFEPTIVRRSSSSGFLNFMSVSYTTDIYANVDAHICPFLNGIIFYSVRSTFLSFTCTACVYISVCIFSSSVFLPVSLPHRNYGHRRSDERDVFWNPHGCQA